MKAIYLTGFMGAGKTTVGKLLAETLKLPVLDTDQQIIKKLNMTIKEIFELHGESFFRNAETDILKELPAQDAVITTGGGIIIKEENRKLMKTQGVVVFLNAELDILYERVHSDTNRPLASKKSFVEFKDLYKSRESFYNDCSFIVETANKSVKEVVNEIQSRLK